MELNLEQGQYLVMVEAYWSNNLVKSFNVGTYSTNDVEIQLLDASEN